MAAPFVYVPEEAASAPYSARYLNPYFASPQAGASPFLPPSLTLYPSSPYRGTTDLPNTPNAFNPNSVFWPEDVAHYESPYAASWIPLQPRLHTNLWSTPAPPPGSPFLSPSAPAFLTAQSSYFRPGHKKANSWSIAPSWLTDANPYATAGGPQAAVHIHPFLNGDMPSPDFHFDLAPSAFFPMRRVSMYPPSGAPVGAAELREPAFHPPRFALRILHGRLPFWPIDLTLQANTHAPPITLADALVALHRAFHTRITHAEWAQLGREDEVAVTNAFTARCRMEALRSGAAPAQLRDREMAVRSQGVLRVDFLRGKTMFKGLVRAPGDPEGCVRLVTA
ncbi:hypothetical protein DFH06DRAFT_995252 [Mycena polygramma]|nr:hypothetical protein DFH06DRAFT_995252 [Mycena polygramma]